MKVVKVLVAVLFVSATSLAIDFGNSEELIQAMNDLQAEIARTRETMERYMPDLVDMGNNLSANFDRYFPDVIDQATRLNDNIEEFGSDFRSIGEDLSSSISDGVNLAEDEVPSAKESLQKGADALMKLGKAASYVQEYDIGIAVVAFVVLAGGVLVGEVLSHHVFTLNKKHNVFCKSFRGCMWIYKKAHPPKDVAALPV